MMDFVAIDVETANADLSSICHIGIAKYSNSELVDEWSSLIDPEDYFDLMNIYVHGITEGDIKGAPILPQIVTGLQSYMDNVVCVSHTHFDRVSITRAFSKYGLKPLDVIWLDSARVARRAWKQFARSGYGLSNICKHIGYEFKHHDALEDAKASGQIILTAVKQTGIGLGEWLKRVNQPIELDKSSGGSTIRREGNLDGDLCGEVLCFTGALEISRKEAADLAASVGCTIVPGVTRNTTLLVVGNQDITKLAGKDKSSKHRKAEELISKGHAIRILTESDFKALIAQVQKS